MNTRHGIPCIQIRIIATEVSRESTSEFLLIHGPRCRRLHTSISHSKGDDLHLKVNSGQNRIKL